MPDFMQGNFFPTEDQVPSYLRAADNHTLGATEGGSWFDPAYLETKIGNGGKLLAAGVLSGANSFWNTGVAIGRWAGADIEYNDTGKWIASIDDDIGAYYNKNSEAADLVGLVAGSLIPGTLGIKALNMGQKVLEVGLETGQIGGNLARATGLLVPRTEMLVQTAAKDMAASQATFGSLNLSGLNALRAGVQQNILEGIAFETAVQATMFKSPILSEQDGWDIAKNIITGGLVQGAIGGAFTAASLYGKMRAEVNAVGRKITGQGSREIAAEGLTPAERIRLYTEDREAAVAARASLTPATENFSQLADANVDKVRRINNDIRQSYHDMTSGNQVLGNMLADMHTGVGAQDAARNLWGVTEVGSIGQLSSIEREATKLAKAGSPPAADASVSYLKLTGEGAGKVSSDAPIIYNLADRFSGTADQIKSAVLSAVKEYKFKVENAWDATVVPLKTGHFESEARYIWADNLKEIKPGTAIGANDFPLLQRALKDSQLNIKVVDAKGAAIKETFSSPKELQDFIVNQKQDAAAKLLIKSIGDGKLAESAGNLSIAKILDISVARLEGTAANGTEDFFASSKASEQYRKLLQSKGLIEPADVGKEYDTRFLPTYAKLSHRTPEAIELDGNVLNGMAYIKQKQAQLQDGVNNVVARHTKELYDLIPEIRDADVLGASRRSAGAGFVRSANDNYGTLGSKLQASGSAVQQLTRKFSQDTAGRLEGVLHNVLTNQEAAVEFSTLNQKVNRSGKLWKYSDEAGGLVEASALDAIKAGKLDIEELAEDQLISISNQAVHDLVQAHIERTGERTTMLKEVRAAANGMEDHKSADVFRSIRPNPKDYPYYAFVKDPRVTGTGHTSMIFASSEEKLAKLIQKAKEQFPEYDFLSEHGLNGRVLTKEEISSYKRARQEYDYERTLHENYIDTNLKNAGIMSDFFTSTDPQKIVNEILQQHARQDRQVATELVRAKNARTFDWLEDQAAAESKTATSKLGYVSDRVELQGNNPFTDYIRMGLDIHKTADYPVWGSLNRLFEGATNKVMEAVGDAIASAKVPQDLDKINAMLQKHGMNTAFNDAATLALANHVAPKAELSKFIGRANALLSKLTLGLDPLNAVNNFIGAWVLRGTELKQITRAIQSGNTELAGELAKLSKIDLPGGLGSITAPTKLVAQAFKNFTDDIGNGKVLMEKYKQLGFVKGYSTQFADMIDSLALRGTESVADLNSKIAAALKTAQSLSEKGERLTGNKLAEELNRFISANVADQLTELGVKHGVLSQGEKWAYVNTFVNRVEGTTVASQRPMLFTGPIGQAVGLFQSYQFNLMQQLFRYVAEGNKKDVAMLMGLQGTFFGMNGLPAFQFMNQHIVGSLSGNKEHRDLYDATVGVAGKGLGDLLMYGLPSNMLQANLYTRGDINPRQLTVIPASLPEIPIVGAYTKFLGSVYETTKKIAGGGAVWESMLQGLEHNGLNRPLAGMAQVLQATGPNGKVFSTTGKGTILGSNDLVSWASAVRLAGGRPLDEAIVQDRMFAFKSYAAADKKKMDALAETVKSTAIQGRAPDSNQVSKFAESYAAAGGTQTKFNQFMLNQLKSANTSEAQKIAQSLHNPFAQRMQSLMGGDNP